MTLPKSDDEATQQGAAAAPDVAATSEKETAHAAPPTPAEALPAEAPPAEAPPAEAPPAEALPTSDGELAPAPSVVSPALQRAAYVVIALFVLIVLRRAWMSDDGFITLRAVDNLLHGRGFGFNADERVLGFTNPLWALLLVLPFSVIRDPFLAPVVLGVVVSGAFAVALVYGAAKDVRSGLLALAVLGFSRYFTDFSTSGLENPLTHLLLAVFFAAVFRGPRARLVVYLAASLSFVNRPDSAPLLLAPLLFVLWRDRKQLDLRQAAIGVAPAVAWLLFATIYYGFPFPNTAYAKLNSEIPRHELVRQGLGYLMETAHDDAALAIVIVVGIAVTLLQVNTAKALQERLRAGSLLVSLLAGMAYVISIGGDFMAGRFLTPLAVVAAIGACQFAGEWLDAPRGVEWAALLTGVVLATLSFSPWREDRAELKREFPPHRIVDERSWYREHLALVVNLRPTQWKEYGLFGDGRAARERGDRVVVFNNVGMFAWGAGPGVYIVDELALTDPLLARLPFEYRPDWRPGHLPRPIPAGYVETLREGRNLIADACIRDYYEKLRVIVRGPLFSAERFAAMLELNLPSGATIKACPGRAR